MPLPHFTAGNMLTSREKWKFLLGFPCDLGPRTVNSEMDISVEGLLELT